MIVLEHMYNLPPTNFMVAGDQVHVWRASLDPPLVYVRSLVHTLSADEQIRTEQLYFERDRKRFIVGRGLLRMILGRYIGIAPERLRFQYGSAGKPALATTPGIPEVQFNVSHSHGLVLYAVTRDRQIGVDLEHIRPILGAEQIAARVCSPREQAVFRALPAMQRQVAFFHCWTCKEAYVKACGDGLARPLNQIDVSLAPSEPARSLSIAGASGAGSRWSLHELNPAPGYVAALAVERDNLQLCCWQWSKWL